MAMNFVNICDLAQSCWPQSFQIMIIMNNMVLPFVVDGKCQNT